MFQREREEEKTPEAVLKEAGFSVSEKCSSRHSCFDYAARKGENVVFIKFQMDIDGFSFDDSQELRLLSECISAAYFLVSERTREKPLEDDTVYRRYEVFAVTPKTFENIVLHKIYPLIQAGPGGYYVEIDGETIKRRRQELGLSAGEAAEMIGISRRTLYGYERGMAKASVAAAYNLIYALGAPVAKPINVFDKPKNQRKCSLLRTAGNVIAKNKLLARICSKFSRSRVTMVKRAPFDFVITIPEEKMKIVGGVASDRERTLNRRVEEILSVSRVIKARPILITEKQKPTNKDIPCIYRDDLSKIRKLEDIICMV
ncbi:MAG: helix-turn-helix domain-containing protein [Candidatus Bathyarchaeota archaeon]|nr:helix-turn-helix domain-containing protein [Candidatus Bathyarchaeota archaeon]